MGQYKCWRSLASYLLRFLFAVCAGDGKLSEQWAAQDQQNNRL